MCHHHLGNDDGHIIAVMVVTETVPETVLLNELTRLIVREVFISGIASLNNLRGKNIEKFFFAIRYFYGYDTN
jgi:hypothetical protein